MRGFAQLAQRAQQPVHDPVGNDAVDPRRHPAVGMFRDFLADHVLLARERYFGEHDGAIERLFGGSAGPQHRQQLRCERGGRDRFDPVTGDLAEQVAGDRAGQRLQDFWEDLIGVLNEPPANDGIVEPLGEPADDIDLGQPIVRNLHVEEIVGDETTERRADAVLVARNDRGVRDRNSERMAKQRNHGEPVGAGADHAGFREGPHIGQPRPIDPERGSCDKHHGHQNKQECRDGSHASEIGASCVRVLLMRWCFARSCHGNCAPSLRSESAPYDSHTSYSERLTQADAAWPNVIKRTQRKII